MATKFGQIYKNRGLMDALMGISEDTPEADINNITTVEQLQNALKPSNDQRKQAFWQGLYNAGTALQEGRGLGAGLMDFGNTLQQAKQPNQKVLEQIQTRSALQKLLQKPARKIERIKETDAQGNPVESSYWLDEAGKMELVNPNARVRIKDPSAGMDDLTRQIKEMQLQNLQSQIGARDAKSNPAVKPTPSWLGRIQNEELGNLGLTATIAEDLSKTVGQLESGKIPLGPVENLLSRGKNWAGASDEGSRQFATLKATIEKMRNDSLKLNKGVQTEGDAQRAFNEILENLNDPALVKQRLSEIADINRRGAALKISQINQMRQSAGLDPLSDEELGRFTAQQSPLFNSGGQASQQMPQQSSGWSIRPK